MRIGPVAASPAQKISVRSSPSKRGMQLTSPGTPSTVSCRVARSRCTRWLPDDSFTHAGNRPARVRPDWRMGPAPVGQWPAGHGPPWSAGSRLTGNPPAGCLADRGSPAASSASSEAGPSASRASAPPSGETTGICSPAFSARPILRGRSTTSKGWAGGFRWPAGAAPAGGSPGAAQEASSSTEATSEPAARHREITAGITHCRSSGEKASCGGSCPCHWRKRPWPDPPAGR